MYTSGDATANVGLYIRTDDCQKRTMINSDTECQQTKQHINEIRFIRHQSVTRAVDICCITGVERTPPL